MNFFTEHFYEIDNVDIFIKPCCKIGVPKLYDNDIMVSNGISHKNQIHKMKRKNFP